MQFLPIKSKTHSKDIVIDLIVNSFSGSIIESQQSNEMLRILNCKGINIRKILDINQDLIFEKDKSKWLINLELCKNIRESYHQNGLLFKLNNQFSIPQIKINSLVLSYPDFILINELGILDKIVNKTQCEHIRLFNNSLVYSKPIDAEDSMCIYCYSLKRKSKMQNSIKNCGKF